MDMAISTPSFPVGFFETALPLCAIVKSRGESEWTVLPFDSLSPALPPPQLSYRPLITYSVGWIVRLKVFCLEYVHCLSPLTRLSLALDTLTEHRMPKYLPLHLPEDRPKSKADTTKLLDKATSTAVEYYTRETQVRHLYHKTSTAVRRCLDTA